MQITVHTHSISLLAALFILSGIACNKPPADKTEDQNQAGEGGKKDTHENGEADGKKQNGSNASAQAKGPCDVISQDELEGITGVKFPHTTPHGNLKALATCEYHSEGAKDSIIVAVVRGSSGAKARVESAKQFPNYAAIEGIGDEAVWVAALGSLDVRSGDFTVSVKISASLDDEAERLKYAKQIAQLLLDRV